MAAPIGRSWGAQSANDAAPTISDGRKGERTGEPADSIRLWALPARAPEPVQLGKEVEVTIWQDKVI